MIKALSRGAGLGGLIVSLPVAAIIAFELPGMLDPALWIVVIGAFWFAKTSRPAAVDAAMRLR